MRTLSIIFLLSLLAACSGGRSGNTLLLERIDSLTSVNPAKAAALLDSIDPATLSEEERHHRDLLTIKAADKGYVIHTSPRRHSTTVAECTATSATIPPPCVTSTTHSTTSPTTTITAHSEEPS